MKRLLPILLSAVAVFTVGAASLFTPIDLGSSANDGTGDKPRPAGTKINAGFAATEAAVTALEALTNALGSAAFSDTGDFQPAAANLNGWSAVPTNTLGDYVLQTQLASARNADTNAAINMRTVVQFGDEYSTSTDPETLQITVTIDTNAISEAELQSMLDAVLQSATNYAAASDAARTNDFHLRVTNNIYHAVHVVSPVSNGTNYLLDATKRRQLINVTGNVRIVGVTGTLPVYGADVSLTLSNGTGTAYTIEWTNTFHTLRGSTNTIPSNSRSKAGFEINGSEVDAANVPKA